MIYLTIYFISISLLSVIITIADKRRAKKQLWRISEKLLFTLALLGGALSMWITMLLIRHKTKHKRFMIGLPLIALIQCILLLVLIYV
ncbi:MAG: DUF1294 domain-containing protein [Clostridia bacterium]|nr:DUF1294 domain-containing protein [Clostridia bacterium]